MTVRGLIVQLTIGADAPPVGSTVVVAAGSGDGASLVSVNDYGG
jgi:hypothetical protein